MSWWWIVVAVAACFACKVLGLLVPAGVLAHPALARTAEAAPVALLAGLIGVQTLTVEQSITVDYRLAGLAVAAVCVWRRAPFLVVVLAATVTTAGLRWLAG